LLLVLQTYIVNRLSEYFLCDEFPDINGVIGIRKSKKNRQHNGQKKKGQKEKQRST
jgi:hypothetical protein